MSYHYNEAFENPDYHNSETLESGRRKASQMNSMFRQNPYDSSPYDSYTDHDGREQRQSYSVDIPMATMQPGLEVSQSAKRWGTPNANPYGNTHINHSFEYEPEFTYTPPSTLSTVDGPFARRSSDASEGVAYSKILRESMSRMGEILPKTFNVWEKNTQHLQLENKHPDVESPGNASAKGHRHFPFFNPFKSMQRKLPQSENNTITIVDSNLNGAIAENQQEVHSVMDASNSVGFLMSEKPNSVGLLMSERANLEGECSAELPISSQMARGQRKALLDSPHSSDSAAEASIVQRRNRQRADSVFTTSSDFDRTDANAAAYNENKESQEEKIIRNLASMTTRERIKAIQKMPKTMKEKREIRNKVLMEKTRKSVSYSTEIHCCTQCMYKIALSYRRFRNGLSELFQSLQLWQKTLKIIGGKFGTSVLSYFVFLTWLLTFNIFSFLVNFSFVTIPQFIAAGSNNLSFTGLELLTGAGYFQQTVLYYGFYTNSTITKIENSTSYDMQLAYIFTIGIYFVICFFSLVYSMAKSFRNNFVNPQTYSGNAGKLLCIWDFNITNEKAVRLKQKNLSTQIKEALSEGKSEDLNLSLKQRMVHIAIHLAAWIFSLGTTAVCCTCVYYLSINNLKLFMKGDGTELENQAATLVLPIVVSLLNLLTPFVFSLLELLEKFQYPRNQIYVTITRNVILKMSIIGILCYYWLNIVATSATECWETLVGQDIYRLVVVDFLFCLLGSFFGEFIRRIIGTKCLKNLGVPEFDIARNVLGLIYVQTLTWIGIFFSPLLPAIQIIFFFIIFYVKKVSLMMNCQPPRKVWRASQMTTLFIFLLFFPSFTGVLSVVAITIWRLNPSEKCGPFRGLSSIFDAVSRWIDVLTNYPRSAWVVWIYHNLIESVHFFFILTVIIIIITYLYWQIIEGRKIMVRLLHEQIINEGKDKMFLLEKLRALQASTRDTPARKGASQQFSTTSSLYQPPGQLDQQRHLSMPNYLERPLEKNKSSFSAKPPYTADFPETSGFLPGDPQRQQPSTKPGVSEALALAMRARQQAEREMEDEDEEDFRS